MLIIIDYQCIGNRTTNNAFSLERTTSSEKKTRSLFIRQAFQRKRALGQPRIPNESSSSLTAPVR